MFVVLWLLLQSALAGLPAEPSAPVPAEITEEAAENTFEADLSEAKALYFRGKTQEAHQALLTLERRLLRGEEIAPEVRAEALIWLGEVQYTLGHASEARDAFRWLLQQDPNWPISPYAHPIEVIGEFELVRRQVLEELEASRIPPRPLVAPPPAPLWTWAPFGAPQLAQGRPRAALNLGALQVGLAAASIGLHVHLNALNQGPDDHPRGWNASQIERRVTTYRYALQWPITFAFYGTWFASSMEARHHHRQKHLREADGPPPQRSSRAPAPPVSVGWGRFQGDAQGIVISGGF